MRVKAIVMEDFVNYKEPSMFISTCFCNWKCCHEGGFDESICQNSPLALQENKEVSDVYIYNNFINNPITKAIVLGGLEPMMQFEEVYNLIKFFREQGQNCPFIIYTGYYKKEITGELERLKKFDNIIIKYGRYVPGQTPHYDEVLGINLVSDNQYGEKIS